MGALLLTALLNVAGRLVSQKLFEAVATQAFIWLLDKITPMTSNTLDDSIAAEIKARLSVTSNYDALITAAASRADYVEVARLINERDGTKP